MTIVINANDFIAALSEAGMPADKAMQCVMSSNDGSFTVDDSCDECLFVRELNTGSYAGRREFVLSGPGTELSRLLKRFGIEPTPTCQCRDKQQQMDLWGCDECSKPERIEEVVKVMREEAAARGLPFIDAVGRMLVKRAIANARRNA